MTSSGQSEAGPSTQDSSPKDEVSSFFGVYLLYTLNPKYKGRTYIGFTVDPERRLKQHNRGKEFGGAYRTSNRGPWEMILIVHGFPNQISALRFEWAWQHPKRSRRLSHLPPKKSREKMFDYNFRLLGEMLNMGPWNRLPLVVRWLRPDIKFSAFPSDKQLPGHMSVVHGPVKSIKAEPIKNHEESTDDLICSICIEPAIKEDQVQCLSDKCGSISHLACLAKRFLGESNYILPINGSCPVCDVKMLWGEIIKRKKQKDSQSFKSSDLQTENEMNTNEGTSDQELF